MALEETERTTLYVTKAERATRLADLGLTEEELRDALSYGIAEASRCTENDPRIARGWIRWAKTIRALREALTSKGWTRQESRNYPVAVDSRGVIAITASSADGSTGTEADPHTTSAKGPATKHAISKNQLTFFDLDPIFPPDPEAEREPDQTWLLLYHEDDEAGETRLELSLPVRMEIDGHVSGWRERIILEPIGSQSGPLTAADEEGEPIDVKVERRA
ncbi:MAG TPA: hypothetical protein VFA08_01430 [Actinomycetota bacterium]|nr:hypothetical protein [Actinomycetota bacterium]